MIRIPPHKILLAIGDYIVLVASYVLAVQLRLPDLGIRTASASVLLENFLFIFLLYALLWLALFQNFNLYKIHVFTSVIEQFVAIVKSMGYGLIGLILVSYFTKE